MSVSVRALLVPQHSQPEHKLVEAEGVLERADLGHPVERAHVRRQPRRDADVIDRGGFQRHDVVRGVRVVGVAVPKRALVAQFGVLNTGLYETRG